MSDDRLERILDAAYACFARHGVRRTTMDDIAASAEMSRAAVYQHVQNKDDAFRRLSARMFDSAVADAHIAAAGEGGLAQRLHNVLAVKLELVIRLSSESPHAEELLGASTRLNGDLFISYTRTMLDLTTGIVADAQHAGEVTLVDVRPAEVAEIGLALAHGLLDDMTEPELIRRRLQQGVVLLVGGLKVPSAAPQPG